MITVCFQLTALAFSPTMIVCGKYTLSGAYQNLVQIDLKNPT